MDRIGTRELEYFVAVAEELHFSRAAARLHVSQPPLSRQIKALEDKLGVVLLNRDTQKVTLTRAGALLLADGRQILRQLDQAADAVRRAGKGQVDRFEIGFVGTALDERMTRILYRFRQAQPKVQVRLHEMEAPALIQAVQDEKLDGAFIGAAPAQLPKGFRLVLWRMVSSRIAMSREHPLAGRHGLHLRELAQEAWISLSPEAAPAYHRQFLRWCADEGFRPRIVAESSRVPPILAMVAIGDGISLVPKSTIRTGAALPELRFQRLLSPFALLVSVFACREGDASPILNDFIRILEEEAELEPDNDEEDSLEASVAAPVA